MVSCGKAQALIRLRHQVADVNLDGRRIHNGLSDAMYQQVWNEAGEKGAGADTDHIGAGDVVEGLRQRLNIGRNQKKFLDAPFTGSNFGFSENAGAIFH